MKKIVFFVAVVSCGIVSCNKHSELDFNAQLQKDIATIDAYLASNNINATKDPSGLRYVITSVGTGLKPTLDGRISVKYTARFLSTNQIFDQTTNGVVFAFKHLSPGLADRRALDDQGEQIYSLYTVRFGLWNSWRRLRRARQCQRDL